MSLPNDFEEEFFKASSLHVDKSLSNLSSKMQDELPNKRFVPLSALLFHLESGSCAAGWNIHHINALAVSASHSEVSIYLIKFRGYALELYHGSRRTLTMTSNEARGCEYALSPISFSQRGRCFMITFNVEFMAEKPKSLLKRRVKLTGMPMHGKLLSRDIPSCIRRQTASNNTTDTW